MPSRQIVLFQSSDGVVSLPVQLASESVGLTQAQMAIASVAMATSLLFGGWLCYTLCNGGLVAFTLAIVGFLAFSVTGAVLMAAAYDNLICPRCGQRTVEIKRNLADKENHRRYKAILKGEPMKCAYCGAEIETA